MSRLDYRGGKSPIKTSEELAKDLTLPLYMLLVGKAEVHFPTTDRSNPSVSVGIRSAYPPKDLVWVHWTQWQNIIVPLLKDNRLTEWRHQLGYGDWQELKNLSVGFLYSCDLSQLERDRPGSKNSAFLKQLNSIIAGSASTAGY